MLSRFLNIKFIFLCVVGLAVVQPGWLNCLFAADEPLPGSEIKIIVKENSFVKSAHIFLGDVSDIHANGILKEALEKIALGSSPKPDKIKSFNKTKLISAIRSQRYLPKNFTLISPERIYVKRLSQTISKQAIQQMTDQRLSRIFKDREYELKKFNVRGLGIYPQGETDLRLESDELVDKNGKLSFSIDVVIDEEKVDRVNVTGSVALYDTVFHAAASCRKGAVITKETVYREKKNVFELGDDVIRTFEEIDGKIFRSGIRKGEVLTSGLLTDPPLIKKGEIVQLVSQNEKLLIVTSAISREDGFENKLIRVENLSSGKLVRGIVTGKSKVEVQY